MNKTDPIDPDEPLELLGSSSHVSLFSVLYKMKRDALPVDIGTVRLMLEKNPSSVHEVQNNLQPLHIALSSRCCTVELVQLLVDYGAELNKSESCQLSSVLIALMNGPKSRDIIQVLLDGGAFINISDIRCYKLWSVLHAFVRNAGALQMFPDLIDPYGSYCQKHRSLLDCYIHTAPFLSKRTIQLLLDRGADAVRHNSVYFGQSTLCRALEKRSCTIPIVKLLLEASTSVIDCDLHEHPLLCYVSRSYNRSADIVKLFLDVGIDVNEILPDGETLLHTALSLHEGKTEDIELLLCHKGTDIHVKTERDCEYTPGGSTLLHCALLNPTCKLGVIRLLLEKGARLDDVNNEGDLPLHCAVQNRKCTADIIELLINYGSPLNYINYSNETPLRLALNYGRNLDIIKLLLAAGARCVNQSLFLIALDRLRYSSTRQNSELVKLLVMYSLLEDSCIDLKQRFQRIKLSRYFRLAEKYIYEMRQMQALYISQHCSLWGFVSRFPYAKRSTFVKSLMVDYDLDKLLEVLSSNAFPLFFEVISSKVERLKMVPKLCNSKVYVLINRQGTIGFGEKRVTLDPECVAKIASLLSDKDLFSLLVAYS